MIKPIYLSLIYFLIFSLFSTNLFAEKEETATKDIHQALLKKYKPEKIAEHTYVIHGPTEYPNIENQGFMNNPGFIVTDKSVIVIDPGSSVQIGRALLQHIKEITDKPVTHIFNSHIHGDHWLANQAFHEKYPKVKIYAHPEMIKKAKSGDADNWINLLMKLTDKAIDGTKAVIPTEVLQNEQAIKIDNITIKIHLSDWAHTKTDAMFEVVEDKVLFTGDNVINQRMGRMDDSSFRGSIAIIKTALKLPTEIIVPGHGLTGDKQVLIAAKDYLSIVYENVKILAEEGLQDFEMKPKIAQKVKDYEKWIGFKEEFGKHISLAVLETEQAEFE